MRAVAAEALAQYGMPGDRLTLLRHMENTTYRVDVGGGRSLPSLLRVHGYHTASAVRSECRWLAHLRGAAGIMAPQPLRSRNGRTCVEIAVPWSRRRAICSLLAWVPGRQLAQSQPGPTHFTKLGRLMARLHVAARGWQAPRSFERPHWDWDGLFGDEGVFGRIGAHGWPRLPAATRRLFRGQAERLRGAMHALGREPAFVGLIHADLHFGNVVFEAGDVHPIDFDDCGIGYWLYDIAAAMRPWRTDPHWPVFWAAFQQGYRAVAALPPGIDQLDLFIIGRHIATTLWASSRAAYSASLAASLRERCDGASRAITALCAGQVRSKGEG
jgi:Ser/Thr protein kinase RdoA (MazF antagonist)